MSRLDQHEEIAEIDDKKPLVEQGPHHNRSQRPTA